MSDEQMLLTARKLREAIITQLFPLRGEPVNLNDPMILSSVADHLANNLVYCVNEIVETQLEELTAEEIGAACATTKPQRQKTV